MDFATSIRTCFSKYATFAGRAGRPEFWFFVLFQLLAGAAAAIIDIGFLGRSADELNPVGALVNLALLLPSLAVHVRRLHDKDYSGWWVLLYLFPIIGWLVLLVLFCQRGTPGPNRFGPDTMAGAAADAVT